MKATKLVLLILTGIFLMAGSASASTIDFTDSYFGTIIPGTPTGSSTSASVTAGTATVNFDIDGYFGVYDTGTQSAGNLYWDDEDGIGLTGEGYEGDEIESPEYLVITFDEVFLLTSISLTDFFSDEDDSPETGTITLIWGSTLIPFGITATSAVGTNGEFELDIVDELGGAIGVNGIVFTAPGKTVSGLDQEYSVAGLGMSDGDINVIPEPATMVLLGMGLFGLGVAVRRKKLLK